MSLFSDYSNDKYIMHYRNVLDCHENNVTMQTLFNDPKNRLHLSFLSFDSGQKNDPDIFLTGFTLSL